MCCANNVFFFIIICVSDGEEGEVCANFILGVINTCENFETKAMKHASHGMNLILKLFE